MTEIGCNLATIRLQRRRGVRLSNLAKYEPYVVGTFITQHGEIRFQIDPLKGVKRGKLLQLDPQSVLVEPQQAGDHVLGRLEVWESDSGFRDLGEKIELVQKKIKKSKILDKAASLATGGKRSLISKVVGFLGEVLSKNGDDFISGFDLDFDPEETPPGSYHTLSDRRSMVTLMVTEDI